MGSFCVSTAVIPHGIESRFLLPPRKKEEAQLPSYHTFRLLYVSIQLPYKHHLEVMMAVSKLRGQGLPVTLKMAGDNQGNYGNAVRLKRLELDPDQTFLLDSGHINFENLHDLYKQADAFIFASSCENLPNILIEAMAAGLPIASSNSGPMPEVLGDAGVYFYPESVESIADAINLLANDDVLRENLGRRAREQSQSYSWQRCARETLNFVANIASQNK
jgi:glycosyltransferase involved in cell wall biosynthesis